MGDSNSTSPSKSVFEQIEDALGSTVHGRAFLRECGRRARSEEASLLLDAVARLERQARRQQGGLDRQELQSLVAQIEAALRETKLALLGSIASPRGTMPASASLATFGQETANSIFQAAELVQETAWAMREAGFDSVLCDRLDEQTSAIYDACRRQERMLLGLSTVERAVGRTDACLTELRRAIMSTPPASPSPLAGEGPAAFGDDIESTPRAR